MKRATGEERALARASLYRLLSLAFSYPTEGSWASLGQALDAGAVAAELIDEATEEGVAQLTETLGRVSQQVAESSYQTLFTVSYNEDCPPFETAFSASHLFQQTHHLADISGFYQAFGVKAGGERPDHLALELEFCYLLALKEARARELKEPEHIEVSRNAQRVFLKEHLARWAPTIGQRIAVTGAGSPYEGAGKLLSAFVAAEERYLRLGAVDRYRDEPILIADEPGEMTCPIAEGAAASLTSLLDTDEEALPADVGS